LHRLLTIHADDTDLSSVGDRLIQTLKKVGTISVKIYRVKNLKPVQLDRVALKPLSEVGTVPEKAMKGRALTHSTGYVLSIIECRITY
jgi:hypothetical protein